MELDKMGWNETIIVYEYFWSQDFFVHWSFGFFRDICPFECGQKHLCRIYEMSIAPCNLYTRWGRLDIVWFGGFAIENDAIMHRPKILGCSDKLRQICPQYAKRPKFRSCLFCRLFFQNWKFDFRYPSNMWRIIPIDNRKTSQ